MLIKYPAEGQYFQAWESSPQPSGLKMKWLIHYIMTPSSATIGSQSLLMPACDLWLKGLLYGSQSVWVGAQVTTNTLKSMSLPKIIHLPTHTGMFCSWMVLAARLHTIHEILTNCPATLVVKYTVFTCCAIPPKFSLISMPHFLSQHDQNASNCQNSLWYMEQKLKFNEQNLSFNTTPCTWKEKENSGKEANSEIWLKIYEVSMWVYNYLSFQHEMGLHVLISVPGPCFTVCYLKCFGSESDGTQKLLWNRPRALCIRLHPWNLPL